MRRLKQPKRWTEVQIAASFGVAVLLGAAGAFIAARLEWSKNQQSLALLALVALWVIIVIPRLPTRRN